jgi:hypothetical protein
LSQDAERSDDLLNYEFFSSLKEALMLGEQWRRRYKPSRHPVHKVQPSFA